MAVNNLSTFCWRYIIISRWIRFWSGRRGAGTAHGGEDPTNNTMHWKRILWAVIIFLHAVADFMTVFVDACDAILRFSARLREIEQPAHLFSEHITDSSRICCHWTKQYPFCHWRERNDDTNEFCEHISCLIWINVMHECIRPRRWVDALEKVKIAFLMSTLGLRGANNN